MDGDSYLVLLFCVFVGMLILLIIVGIGLVAGYIASWLGFTGLMWWAVTLVFYLIIGAFIGMLNRVGGD